MAMRIGFTLLFATVAATVAAQDFPNKPVKLLVPYAAGGAPDTIGRILAQRLSDTMGQPFIVENRPGAGGIPATLAVAKSPPDGYTLLVAEIAQMAINPFLFTQLPYDPAKDLAPVSLVALTPMFIAAHPSTKITTLQALITHAKAKPGALNYGSAGIGSIHHIAMESLKAALGIDVTHVPYKGSGQSVPAFIGGELTLVVAALPALGGHIKAGRGHLLAATSLHRSAQASDVPAVAETVAGFDFASEIGIVAPAGTPAPVITRLAAEIMRALKHSDTLQRFTAIGADPVGSTPEAYAENIRGNLTRFARAVKISGVKAE